MQGGAADKSNQATDSAGTEAVSHCPCSQHTAPFPCSQPHLSLCTMSAGQEVNVPDLQNRYLVQHFMYNR